MAIGLGSSARADDTPDTFIVRAKTIVDSKARVAEDLRSAFAGSFLSEIRQFSKHGLQNSKETLIEIIDSAKLLLMSDDPADVLLGLRILECVDYLMVVEISRQYASDRGEELSVDYVENSISVELIDLLTEHRKINPKEVLGHVLTMRGVFQKNLLARDIDEEVLIEGVRLRHLSESCLEQYDSITRDLRYLDALPDKHTGDYLLLESLYLCDAQSDVALLYAAYAGQPKVLKDRSSFRTWVKAHIAKHPSKRMLQGKSNTYVLMNPITLKLFFQKESREVKFWFLGERLWPFISGLANGHGLTPEEKATIQKLVPRRSAR